MEGRLLLLFTQLRPAKPLLLVLHFLPRPVRTLWPEHLEIEPGKGCLDSLGSDRERGEQPA